MRKRVAPSAGSGGPPSAPLDGDQSAVFSFLGDARTYGLAGPVKRIDTQGAVVFLAGDERLQGQARDPSAVPRFLDAGKAPRRMRGGDRGQSRKRAAHLSRGRGRHAPGRDPGDRRRGRSRWNGRRTCAASTRTRRSTESPSAARLTRDFVRKLAHAIHLSHERAPTRDGERAHAVARDLSRSERSRLRRAARSVRSARAAATRARFARSARRASGRCSSSAASAATSAAATAICTCATSRSIDGEPVLFDAIEFDPDIATGDILYDLAFALMDLWERGLRPAANLLLATLSRR